VCIVKSLSVWNTVVGFMAANKHLKSVLISIGSVPELHDVVFTDCIRHDVTIIAAGISLVHMCITAIILTCFKCLGVLYSLMLTM
jgi:hypothetical protein